MNSEEFFSKLKSLIPDSKQEDYERNFVITGGRDAISDILKILGIECTQEGVHAFYAKSTVFLSGLGYFDIIFDNAKTNTEVLEGSTLIGNL
jgi:hypothetical protein